jgi:tetratricopeptide (TPR) repeat protein
MTEIARHTRRRRFAAPVIVVCAVAATVTAAVPAMARPNLVVTALADPAQKVVEGAKLVVRDAVTNRGTVAKRSATRYYLTTNPAASLKERRASTANPREALGDILLSGAREVPALTAAAVSAPPSRPTIVSVPIGTAEGTYRLLACADDRAQVTEAIEFDNCRAAARMVKVVAAPAEAVTTDSFSSVRDRPADAADLSMLGNRRALECAPRPPAKAMTLKQALASARARIVAQAGADAMPALLAAPGSTDPVALEQAAARALVADRPGAALAAMLTAHRIRPREASHLANAGVLATSVGLPAEGLSMIEAAGRLDDPDPPAMGISRHAVSLANRGHALVALGRFAEAEAVAGQALAADPYVTEAARTRALAVMCAGGTAPEALTAALPHLRQSRLRPGQIDPPLDESQGNESGMRDVPLPPSPEQAISLLGIYKDWSDRRFAVEIRVLEGRRRQSLGTSSLRPGETRAEWRRRSKVLLTTGAVPLRPEHRARYFEALRLVGEAQTTNSTFWFTTYRGFMDQATKDCTGRTDFGVCHTARMRAMCVPALPGAHQTWLSQITAAKAAWETHQRALSRNVSAVAANLADPTAHAFGSVVIDEMEHGAVHSLMSAALAWSNQLADSEHRDHCLGAAAPPAADPSSAPPAPGAADSGPCPPTLRSINALVNLGQARLRVNCERVQVEGGVPVVVPWMEAFGEVKYDLRTGSLTLIAGAKAKAGAGPAAASFKSGLYLTVGSGGVQDVGWRVGPSVSVGQGLAEFRVDDQMNLSFIGAPTADGQW